MKAIAITARIPESTYQRIPKSARSKNSFIVEAIEEKLQRERQKEIEESLLSLVEEPLDSVEYAMDAQLEALRLGR